MQDRILYFPIRAITYFIIFTLLLFLFGPIQYNINSKMVFILYMSSILVLLNLGFSRGIKKYNIHIKRPKRNFYYWMKLTIIINLIWLVPKIVLRWHIDSFSLDLFIERVQTGLNSPELVYYDKLLGDNSGQIILVFLRFLISPFLDLIIPLAILNWEKLTKKYKGIVIFIIIWEILSWIGIGTIKGLFDFLIIFIVLLIARNYQVLFRNIKKIIPVSLIFGILFLVFFSYSQFARRGLQGNFSVLDIFTSQNNVIDFDNILIRYLSVELKATVIFMTSYLTQGYYALAQALYEPFTWTYGFGNSWMTIRLFEMFFGSNLLNETYIGSLQVSHGIDPYVNWHTIYTWLASDFTFIGVPLVMYLIGKYTAISWYDTLLKKSIFAPAIFSLFFLMLFYSFANNQIISFSFSSFFVFLFFWLSERSIKK